MAIKSIEVRPIAASADSDMNFGAEIVNVDLENLSDSDFSVIHDALYKYQVIVFRDQSTLSPKAQFLLTQRFDPLASSYGHGKTLDAKRSILHPDLKTIPHQPQVQVIGNGTFESYEGLENFTLKHPHHKTFHKTPIPEAEDLEATRFYRWHIDAALYDLHPPKVTTLLAVRVPSSPRRQTLRYDDGTNDTLSVPLGTTAFASGETMYSILGPADRALAATSLVEYAPHPYIWMSNTRAHATGLQLESEGRELADAALPAIEAAKIKILPMCWRNAGTGQLALQIHPCAVRAVHLADGTRVADLRAVRELVYRLQRPGIAPRRVYAHEWREGDCVLFHNRGVLHSVVGAFAPGEERLMRQCNVAASEGVVGPDGVVY